MEALRLEGAGAAGTLLEQVSRRVADLKEKGVMPCLAVVVAGNNPASASYIRGKEKDCGICGIESRVYRLEENVEQGELLALVARLNKDAAVHGVLVQLPLPTQIDAAAVVNAIAPEKDVDGFTPVNMGRMLLGQPCFTPCTPGGIMALLAHYGVEVAGKNCAIIGRSNIVGKPLAVLMTAANATVTLCHSKTKNLADITRGADILAVAMGRQAFVTADMVKPGAVVIDVGINRGADGKLHGDVAPDVWEKAGALTPVPGGVGLMTRAALMANTVDAAEAISAGR